MDAKSNGADAETAQGLAKPSDVKTPEVITSPDQYTSALKKWNESFNVLSAFTSVSGIAPQHGLVASQVRINLDAAYGKEKVSGGGEVYGGLPFLNGAKGQPNEELALSKNGLRKLAECAGISYRTDRTDPRTISNYWEFKAIASYRGIDGSTVTREATMEWDLRDGSERMKGWTANQITEGRKNGLRNCEARAINAVIRECGCGIKQKYTRAELAKPFLVLRVAFQPDMRDPEQRRMVTEAGLRSTSTLYGPPAAARALPHHEEGDVDEETAGEPRSVGSGTAAPAADLPPVEGAVRIEDVREKRGETNGRKWLRYLITDSNGVQHSTFSETIANKAAEFKISRAWAEVVLVEDGDYKNLKDIIPAGSEPKLPDLENT
jgi:hypothetical protein